MNKIKIITNGILKENPVLVLLLGMCPTLATTTSAINGLSMGLATMSVLICTNFVISCIKSITPDKVRIPVFIVVIAAVVTRLILGRAESFAAKNNPVASLADGVGMGLGFTLGLTVLGIIREILGAGSIFGLVLLPEVTNVLLFVLPPGAFISLGYLIAVVNKIKK